VPAIARRSQKDVAVAEFLNSVVSAASSEGEQKLAGASSAMACGQTVPLEMRWEGGGVGGGGGGAGEGVQERGAKRQAARVAHWAGECAR